MRDCFTDPTVISVMVNLQDWLVRWEPAVFKVNHTNILYWLHKPLLYLMSWAVPQALVQVKFNIK